MDDFNFDDDVFTERVERKAIPLVKDYQAKIDVDGWFHDIGDIRQRMTEKLGPVYVKHAIEHDYLHKRYEDALEKALIYIDMVENDDHCKALGTREMCEIALFCAARLERWDMVETYLDEKQTAFEPGQLMTRGRLYPKCGRCGDAITNLVKYCRLRKRDYQAWRLIAQAFWQEREHGVQLLHLAHLCQQRALRIMTTFGWRLDIPMVKQRYLREKQAMDELNDSIEAAGGQLDTFLAWMDTHNDADRHAAGLDSFAWDDLLWIDQEWRKRLKDTETMLDDNQDGERAVKDL
ncbi:hypothetical protein BC940DRAFT_287611 [Gongronella butleri]|nr:hypothetical protein BC940DRAFT_287611 [Gongronella butleri]